MKSHPRNVTWLIKRYQLSVAIFCLFCQCKHKSHNAAKHRLMSKFYLVVSDMVEQNRSPHRGCLLIYNCFKCMLSITIKLCILEMPKWETSGIGNWYLLMCWVTYNKLNPFAWCILIVNLILCMICLQRRKKAAQNTSKVTQVFENSGVDKDNNVNMGTYKQNGEDERMRHSVTELWSGIYGDSLRWWVFYHFLCCCCYERLILNHVTQCYETLYKSPEHVVMEIILINMV